MDPAEGDRVVCFSEVYVTATADTADTINAKLAAGLHVLITPGVYLLDKPLRLSTAGQVLLGLGIATLVSANGTAVVEVRGDAALDGRVAGLLLEAGPMPTKALLVWGEEGEGGRGGGGEGNTRAGTASANTSLGAEASAGVRASVVSAGVVSASVVSAGVISDLFARVGGTVPAAGKGGGAVVQAMVEVMVQVYSDGVIGDNLWLWRADHAANNTLVHASANPCTTGLVVHGDDVVMYGLAVEHTLGDMTVWEGERGRTYFYQAELPYDVTQANYGSKGFVGYRVGEEVTAHEGYGVGVYTFMRDSNVTVASGIAAPQALEGHFISPLSVYLNGHGTCTHVLNDKGAATSPTHGPGQAQYWCGAGHAPPLSPTTPNKAVRIHGIAVAGVVIGVVCAIGALALVAVRIMRKWPLTADTGSPSIDAVADGGSAVELELAEIGAAYSEL
jgi:hypothetical protein